MHRLLCHLFVYAILIDTAAAIAAPVVLDPAKFAPVADGFAHDDDGKIATTIDNAAAWPWMLKNVPLFECPQQQIQDVYYFRWWSYRKHIKQTPDGFVITEFLPDVTWAKKYGSSGNRVGDFTPQ